MTEVPGEADAPQPEQLDTPYVGLVPYDEAHAAFFFGRDDEKRIVSGNLRASDLVLVYGESGVGKTSLLRAGVIHGLRAELRERPQTLEGRALFSICTFSSWRDEPLPALMEAIRASVAEASGHEVAAWSPGTSPVETLREWTEHARTLLVVLDQFEDYFQYHPDEDGEGTFGGELPAIVNDPNLRVHVLLSIREDALGKLDRFKGHIPRLFSNYVRIEHLTRPGARAAAEGPIKAWNRHLPPGEPPYSIEPALVDAVVEAAATGELTLARTSADEKASARDREHVEAPFLQLVLERIWRQTVAAEDRELTLARLEQLGGARRIVENHLLEALAALSDDEREVAADVFRFLVTRSKTKIAHPASDLADWTGRPEPEVTTVLDKLTRAEGGRILRRIAPPPTGDGSTRYELFHDILAEPVLEWRREVEQDRRRRATIRRFVQVGGALLLLSAIFASLGIWALVQRSEARSASMAATSIALASSARGQVDDRFEKSLLLGLEAYRANPTAEATSAMVEALSAARRSGATSILRSPVSEQGFRTIAFSPDGRTLAAATYEAWIHLYDTESLDELGTPLFGHTGEVWGLSFSPDGETLASSSFDGTIRLWDVGEREVIGSPIAPQLGELRNVAFSPDGRTLAVAGSDGTIRLLDVESRRLVGAPFEGHTDEVTSVAWSPDGRALVSGSYDRTVRVWDVRTRTAVRAPLEGHRDAVWAVAWSPDGRTIASGSADQTARLWSAVTGRQSAPPLAGRTKDVWGVAFSPDGRTLASTGHDRTVRLWSARTGKPLGQPLRGHAEGVNSVAFRSDGVLASAGFDATVRLWDVRNRSVFGQPLLGHTDRVKSVEYSPDGKYLASSGFDRTIRLWDAVTGKLVRQFAEGETESVESLAFSPDGTTLAAAAVDKTIGLWRIPAGTSIGKLTGHTQAVHTVAFSPDGSRLASGSTDGTVLLWDFASRQQIGGPLRSSQLQGPVWSVAFSPDGKTLAYGASDLKLHVWDLEKMTETRRLDGGGLSVAFSQDGSVLASSNFEVVQLWDAKTLAGRGELRGHEDRIESISLSADGRLLASAADDETIRVWDVSTRRLLGPPLEDHTGAVFGVAFSPDGTSFASGGDDGAVRLWSGILWRDEADLVEQVCSLVAPGLVAAEWDELAPGLEYRQTCPV